MKPNESSILNDVEPPSGGARAREVSISVEPEHLSAVQHNNPRAIKVTSRGWKLYILLAIIPIIGPFAILLLAWLWLVVKREVYLNETLFVYVVVLIPLFLFSLFSAFINSIVLVVALLRKRIVGTWRILTCISLLVSLLVCAYVGYIVVVSNMSH